MEGFNNSHKPVASLLNDFFDKVSATEAAEGLQDLWYNMVDETNDFELSAMEISNTAYNLNKVVNLLHDLEKHHIESLHEREHQKITMKLREATK